MPGNVSMINQDKPMPGGALPITPGPHAASPGSMLGSPQNGGVGELLTTMMLMDRIKKNSGDSSGGGGLFSGLLGGKGGAGVNATGGDFGGGAI